MIFYLIYTFFVLAVINITIKFAALLYVDSEILRLSSVSILDNLKEGVVIIE